MRFSKRELVLGLAASGSLVLLLSGNALAADQNAAAPVVTPAPQQAAVSSNTVEAKTTSDSSKVVIVLAQSNQSVSEKPAGAAPVGGNAAAAPSVETVKPAAPAAPAADTSAVVSSNAVANPLVLNAPPVAGAAASNEAAPAAAALPAPPAANPINRSHIYLRSSEYPVQPVIVSPQSTPDLATLFRTGSGSNVPQKTPVPALPTGLLGQLTAQLAGSVVKPPFLPVSSPVALTCLFTLMILLAASTGVRAVRSFAAWTYRDGFTYAPRSDVAATFNLLFATPSIVSYVSASGRRATLF